jgi:hypothetical protein
MFLYNKRKIGKKAKIIIIFVIIFLSVLVISNIVFAEDSSSSESAGGFLAKVFEFINLVPLGAIAFLLDVFISLIGYLSTLVTYLLFHVAQYNGFIHEPLVVEVWKLVRDLCNMFFILILLVIAFATILRIERYQIKRALPKLIIMAVLINFSRMICGVLIDLAQVIMMTFLNSINAGAPGANTLIDALGIQKLFDVWKPGEIGAYFWPGGEKGIGPTQIVASQVFGLILLSIACIVILSYTLVLFFRIVQLWVLIILSPIAYVLAAFPEGMNYARRWWQEFTRTVVVGPVVAFFLWLALITSNSPEEMGSSLLTLPKAEGASGFFSGFLNALINANEMKDLFKYILVLIFMIVGLKMAQEAGGLIGQMASNGLAWSKKAGMKIARFGGGAIIWAPKSVSKGVGRAALSGIGTGLTKVGGKMETKRIPGGSLVKMGGGWATDAKSKIDKNVYRNIQNRMEKMGMGENTMAQMSNWYDKSGLKTSKALGWRAARTFTPLKDIAMAAQKGTQDLQRGNKLADKAASSTGKDWAEKMKPEEWMPSSGLPKHMKYFWDNMRTNKTGTDNIRDAIQGKDPLSNSDDLKFVKSVAESLGAYKSEKGGGTIDQQLDKVETIVNSKLSAIGGAKTKIDDYKEDDVMVNYLTKSSDEIMYAGMGSKRMGDGRLRATSFGNETSNAIFVDPSKVKGLEGFRPEGEADFSKTVGFNVKGRGGIEMAASALKGHIDGEINNLKSRGELDGDAKRELSYLQRASERLSKPENLQNIQVIDSTKPSDLQKEGYVHEIVHGVKGDDEKQAGEVTSLLLSEDKQGHSLAEYRRQTVGKEPRPAGDIVQNEDDDSHLVEEEKEVHETINRTINEDPDAKKDKEEIAKLMVTQSPLDRRISVNMSNAIHRLLQSITKQGQALGKLGGSMIDLVNLSGEKSNTTPLEVDFQANVTQKVIEAMKEEEHI